jgi:hypothetical protein
MRIERETDSYNDRRYGKPWIAKVTFEGTKAEFLFGNWIGQQGGKGLLVIDLEIGDVFARGQKDFRKPANSAPDFYILRENGKGEATSKSDAYKYWEAKTSGELRGPIFSSPLDAFSDDEILSEAKRRNLI